MTLSAERPQPPREAPEGYRFEAREDARWRALAGRRRCRRMLANRKACGRPTVAALHRYHSGNPAGQWWHYCAEHMYGRWVENGHVMSWSLVQDEGA